MIEPWIQAGAAGVDSRPPKYPSFRDFSKKVGWYHYASYGSSTDRSHWSRDQFKAALDAMPTDHPERWQYEAGAKYASRYAFAQTEPLFPQEMWVTIFSAMLVLVGGPVFVTSLTQSVWGWAIVSGLALFGTIGYWLHYWTIRWATLRRAWAPVNTGTLGHYLHGPKG